MALILAIPLLWASLADIRTRRIPDGAVLLLIAIAPIRWWLFGGQIWFDLAVPLALAGGAWLITEAIWRRRQVDVFGLGDIKLMFGIGLAIGVGPFWIALFSAAIGGIAYKLILHLRGKESLETPLPFGPFLSAGAMAAWMFAGGM